MYILDYGNSSMDFSSENALYSAISSEESKFTKKSKPGDTILILKCENYIDHIDSTALAMANIGGDIIDFTNEVVSDTYEDAEDHLKELIDRYKKDFSDPAKCQSGEYYNVTWSFESGHLSISGTDKIISLWDANVEKYPWESLRLKTTTITIGEGITSIPSYAFNSFKNLSVINLPTTIVYVGNDILPSPNNVTINVKDFNKFINIKTDEFSYYAKNVSVNGDIINEYAPELANDTFVMPKILKGTSFSRIIVPNGTIVVGKDAFLASKAKSILLPNTIKCIDDSAFDYCKSLTSITIPDSVTSIGNGAFRDCYSLESIDLSDNLIEIGAKSFSSCKSLTRIVIPKGVDSIYSMFDGCSQLQYIKILSDNLQFISDRAFTGCRSLNLIQVNCTSDKLMDILIKSGWSKSKIKKIWDKFEFISDIDIHESLKFDELCDTHNEYYIDFTTVGEVCDWENADKSTARNNTDDAIDAAVSDLANEVVSAINAIASEANAKTKVEDDQSQAEGEGSVAMLVYISKSINRENALKGIANAIDCVGIGTSTFTDYDMENGYTTGYGDNIPSWAQGWTEYPEIEASVDVQLTITGWRELDDNGNPISNQ